MILPRLPRHQWEEKLRRGGCAPLEGKGRLNTAEWWKGPRGVFTVPVEEDGTCDFWAIQRWANWHAGRLMERPDLVTPPKGALHSGLVRRFREEAPGGSKLGCGIGAAPLPSDLALGGRHSRQRLNL
jgi:hypothetical protein